MKKILSLSVLSILLFACSGENKNGNLDEVIQSKDLVKIKATRETFHKEYEKLVADLAKLDKAIEALDTIQKSTLVEVITIKDTLFTHYLEIQGNVDTKENIMISPEYSGVLTQVNVKAGQRVTKGQVLARIDDGGMGSQLAQAETQLALAKTTFEKQKNLWDQKIGSEIQYLQSKTAMESQQKMVAQIKSQVAKSLVKAPFNGTIDEVLIEKGKVVAPGMELFRIVNLTNMYVSTSVPETYIGKLKVGTEVEVNLTSLNKVYKGKVRQVSNYINPNNRSFGIEVSVPNPENLLRPNQVAKLKITDYENKNAIVVPTNLILEDGQKNKYVYTVTNLNEKTGVAKKVLVQVGRSSNNVTEILKGLTIKDVLVSEGATNISEGTKINF
ncbi:efflux RND transporter periplasmic adaptor subunit [Flavobacterium sp.]|jgi:membrane fusion protein (multidrug efflux system)|uniref:efflux RND transporter periplasmic adaptor subunit n=1 Tax=Flavobacterium sp. TaxID=239 RepID=UPI0037BE3C54